MLALHNLECLSCGKVWEERVNLENLPKCTCGGEVRLNFDWKKNNTYQPFTPYWEENLGDKPVYIESYHQLADECNRRGLWCKGLDGGYKSYERR